MLLQARFKSYANGGSLQVTEFMKVIQEMYPEFTDGAAAGLFATFDTDHSGDVDVEVRAVVQPGRGCNIFTAHCEQEFTLGITRLIKGSMSQKLELLFNVLDRDGSGEVGVGDLMAIVRKEKCKANEWTVLTEEVWIRSIRVVRLH